MNDALNKTRIIAAMDAENFIQIQHFAVLDCVDSTNTWLIQQNQDYAICVAEQQTGGRGRNGKPWVSPAGQNLYLSLRWSLPAARLPLTCLSLYLGCVVSEVLAKFGVTKHGVKWPNDIYWQGKKLAGILIEQVHPQPALIIGIGLNVNMLNLDQPLTQPWCSLRQILGHKIDRNQLLATLLNHLIQGLTQFSQLDETTWQAQWQSWDLLQGKSLRVDALGRQYQGFASGIDAHGRLLLAHNDTVTAFSSAEIQVAWTV